MRCLWLSEILNLKVPLALAVAQLAVAGPTDTDSSLAPTEPMLRFFLFENKYASAVSTDGAKLLKNCLSGSFLGCGTVMGHVGRGGGGVTREVNLFSFFIGNSL